MTWRWRELWRALRGLTPLVMSDRWRLWHEANDWRGEGNTEGQR